MKRTVKQIVTVAAALGLSACTQDRITIATPPPHLLTCADEPRAPDLPAVDWTSVETARPVQRERDKATLDYVLGMRSAWGDCAGKVAGLREWSKVAGE